VNILAFFRKPHTEVRYVSATRKESAAARAKASQVKLQLAVACARLTPSQRTAAIEAGKGRR
jgi:hypothetical protein